MDNQMDEIARYRAQIDDVDQQLIACLATRFRLSQTIGSLKRGVDMDVYQHDRANEVRERYASLGFAQGLQPDFVVNMFQLIHEESCRIQRMNSES